jgi:hypothetical protein
LTNRRWRATVHPCHRGPLRSTKGYSAGADGFFTEYTEYFAAKSLR